MIKKKRKIWLTILVVILISIDGGNYSLHSLMMSILGLTLIRLSIEVLPTVQQPIILTRIQEAFFERFPDAKLIDLIQLEEH